MSVVKHFRKLMVCEQLAEVWRKCRDIAHFCSKLTDADSEAAETKSWLEFVLRCGYIHTHIPTHSHTDLLQIVDETWIIPVAGQNSLQNTNGRLS